MPFPILQWREIAAEYNSGTLLLGNGASRAVSDRFAYGSLLEYVQDHNLVADEVTRLFRLFKTFDFELVLRMVWQASNVNQTLGIPDDATHRAYVSVRDALIQAVRDVHVDYDRASRHLPSMYQFLKSFDTVLSLNYDLLVYWTMTYGLSIDDGHRFKDCFTRDRKFDDAWRKFRAPINEQRNTLVFYPHGSLALCRDSVEEEYKIHSDGAPLLEAILDVWQGGRGVPLFVSEGTMDQKVTAIRNSFYLSTVFREVLATDRITLTIYGWALAEHDHHLLKRMAGTGIRKVAVSVHHGDQDFCNVAFQAIKKYLGRVDVDFFDSESPGCWIHPNPGAQI